MEKEQKRYMVVISFDGLAAKDITTIANMEGFKEYLEKASFCKKVKSVYPSLTYPAHTSISTGRYPIRHGIVSNVMLQPKRDYPDWFWYRKHVQGSTFYELAEEKGYRTAALFWPVTAGAKISYNMPEVLANRPWENQMTASLKAGSKLFQMEMFAKYGKLLNGISQPELDSFTHQAFLDTLRNKEAQLFLVHYTDLDTIRHYNGFDSEEAKAALARHAKRLSEIIEALKEKGIYEDTTLVVLGDHSSKDVSGKISLNSLFKKMGYLQTSRNKICSYDVICSNCEGSAYIYVKSKKALSHVYRELAELQSKGYIESIYTTEEAKELGANGNCTFMVEASEGYYFSDDWEGEVISGLTIDSSGAIKVNGHGYHPEKKDYETVFFISGNNVLDNIEVEKMSLVDIGPTLANILGFSMNDTDGKVSEEIMAHQ